jgi:hypothetical protein
MKTPKPKTLRLKKTVNKSVNKPQSARGTALMNSLSTGSPQVPNRLLTLDNPQDTQIAKLAAEKALERMRILIWRLEELEKITGQAIDGLQPMLRNLRHEAFPHFEVNRVS